MSTRLIALTSLCVLLSSALLLAGCATVPLGKPVPDGALVGNFNGPDITGAYGHWSITTDQVVGGHSIASMRLVQGGPDGEAGALQIAGEVKSGFLWGPWAGAVFYPGKTGQDSADLSSKHELVFWTKGDGGHYRVQLNADNDMIPAAQNFAADPEWTEIHLSLNAFGKDLKRVDWIAFTAGDKQPFKFEIADVQIR